MCPAKIVERTAVSYQYGMNTRKYYPAKSVHATAVQDYKGYNVILLYQYCENYPAKKKTKKKWVIPKKCVSTI